MSLPWQFGEERRWYAIRKSLSDPSIRLNENYFLRLCGAHDKREDTPRPATEFLRGGVRQEKW